MPKGSSLQSIAPEESVVRVIAIMRSLTAHRDCHIAGPPRGIGDHDAELACIHLKPANSRLCRSQARLDFDCTRGYSHRSDSDVGQVVSV